MHALIQKSKKAGLNMRHYRSVGTIEKESFTPKKLKSEYGFYIACDDRAILNCVNSLLLSSGMIGLSDTEGKMHYLIDGRRGKNYVLGQVKERVLPLREASPSDSLYEDAVIYRAIDTVIRRYGFSETLMGTRILRVLLFRLYKEPKLLKCASKSLYPLAQPEFHITASQVERNLRYAIRRCAKLKENTRVLTVLGLLLDATMNEVVNKYGRG